MNIQISSNPQDILPTNGFKFSAQETGLIALMLIEIGS